MAGLVASPPLWLQPCLGSAQSQQSANGANPARESETDVRIFGKPCSVRLTVEKMWPSPPTKLTPSLFSTSADRVQPGAARVRQHGRRVHAPPQRAGQAAGLPGDEAVHRGAAHHPAGEPATGPLARGPQGRQPASPACPACPAVRKLHKQRLALDCYPRSERKTRVVVEGVSLGPAPLLGGRPVGPARLPRRDALGPGLTI